MLLPNESRLRAPEPPRVDRRRCARTRARARSPGIRSAAHALRQRRRRSARTTGPTRNTGPSDRRERENPLPGRAMSFAGRGLGSPRSDGSGVNPGALRGGAPGGDDGRAASRDRGPTQRKVSHVDFGVGEGFPQRRAGTSHDRLVTRGVVGDVRGRATRGEGEPLTSFATPERCNRKRPFDASDEAFTAVFSRDHGGAERCGRLRRSSREGP
jgi:hypothetical protein